MKKVKHLLFAIMFASPLQQGFSYFEAIGVFKNQYKEVFEGVDPIQPIPFNQGIQSGLPPDLPRYMLQTTDNKLNFSLSGIRFDFNFYDSELTFEDIKKHIKSVERCLVNLMLPSFRIGIVLEGEINTNNNLDNFIKKYINLENSAEASEWQLSYRNNLVINGLNYNEWIRYFMFQNNPIINYHVDVNNVNEITINSLSNNNDNIISRVGDFIGS